MIRARDLRRCFGERVALDGVSFDLGEGEVLGYVGPNGAGKTTTLRILTGTEPEHSGELHVCGSRMPAARNAVYSEIGYLPQAVAFAPWRSACETLWLLGRLSGMDETRLRHRVPLTLESVGLSAESGTRVGVFSGGMRQRLGLAQALLHEPRLLILDEPFNHLDPGGRVALKNLLADRRRGGTSILFASHILSDVEELVDRLVVIHRGGLHFTGTPADLRRSEAGVEAVELVTTPVPGTPCAFSGIPGVAKAIDLGANRWRLEFAPGASADAATTQAVRQILDGGGSLRSLAPHVPSLEEIIARLGGGGDA